MTRKLLMELPAIDPDILHTPPHILPKLIEMITGDWRPSSSEQEQFLTHLVTCLHCQVVLEMLVVAELDYDKANSLPEGPAQELFAQIKQLIHETQEQPENIGAYVEALDAQGEEEASKRFPVMAKHLRKCKACCAAVKETRTLLHQAEQAGLIAPLETNVNQ